MPTLILALILPLLQAPPRDRPAAVSPTGVVSGRVYAEATGAPIQGTVVVLAVSPRMSTWSSWSPGASISIETSGYSVQTDAAGAFTIAGIEPGEYRLVARPGSVDGRYLGTGYQATRARDSGKPVV